MIDILHMSNACSRVPWDSPKKIVDVRQKFQWKLEYNRRVLKMFCARQIFRKNASTKEQSKNIFCFHQICQKKWKDNRIVQKRHVVFFKYFGRNGSIREYFGRNGSIREQSKKMGQSISNLHA
jgi:hypothetical protein